MLIEVARLSLRKISVFVASVNKIEKKFCELGLEKLFQKKTSNAITNNRKLDIMLNFEWEMGKDCDSRINFCGLMIA